MGAVVRESSLSAILRFYRLAHMLFAPNVELIDLLARRVDKPVYPMKRGVDATLFSPEKRDRMSGEFTIGYVGRLTVEKNIRLLAEIEGALVRSGFPDFRFTIVGQGAEEKWLRSNMQKADLQGALKGNALARAYANLDVFVFPSRTDTFGNVVLEALASGVPAIVTESGGPQFVISHGETGFVARNTGEFVSYIRRLAEDPPLLQMMRGSARAHARNLSWERIFGGMYGDYRKELDRCALLRKNLGNYPLTSSKASGTLFMRGQSNEAHTEYPKAPTVHSSRL
jgi:glycosyltransferase involved in cell wall biosynthesis